MSARVSSPTGRSTTRRTKLSASQGGNICPWARARLRTLTMYWLLVSTSARRTDSCSRSLCRAGETTYASGTPPRSTARARISASILSVLRRCCPMPSARARVVSTINGSCPHCRRTRSTCHPSRHASNATRPGAVPGPSSRSNSCNRRTVIRATTAPSRTSQYEIFEPRSRATLRMVVPPLAPIVCAFERAGVPGEISPGGGTTSFVVAAFVSMWRLQVGAGSSARFIPSVLGGLQGEPLRFARR